MAGKFMMNIRFFITNFRFLFTSDFFLKYFFSLLFLYLLAALAFQGKKLCGHCCLPDSMYETVILMSFFQTICTQNHSMNGCLIIFPL